MQNKQTYPLYHPEKWTHHVLDLPQAQTPRSPVLPCWRPVPHSADSGPTWSPSVHYFQHSLLATAGFYSFPAFLALQLGRKQLISTLEIATIHVWQAVKINRNLPTSLVTWTLCCQGLWTCQKTTVHWDHKQMTSQQYYWAVTMRQTPCWTLLTSYLCYE